MKRKFLSIACCLIMLMSSIMLISGCGKEKPVAVSQYNAEKAISAAIETLETTSAVKMEKNTNLGKSVLIATEDLCYQETEYEGFQSWTQKEGNGWYEYFTTTTMVGDDPAINFNKRLSLDVLEDPRLCSINNIQSYPLQAFSKATKYKGELSVIYLQDEEDKTSNITFKIVAGKLQSLKIGSGVNEVNYTFEYGQKALQDLVVLPEGIEWNLYENSIEVSGLDQQYYVGDNLDLTEAVVKYFEDTATVTPVEFALTRDMITNFSTAEVGNFAMTINFFGVTLNVEYEVLNTPSIG